MMARLLITASAAALCLSGAAVAQDVNPPGGAASPAVAPPSAEPASSTAQATPAQASPPVADNSASAIADPAAPPLQSAAPMAPAAGEQSVNVAANAAVVTPNVLTNGPIPDTAESRAKYGPPDSNAGKRSAAKGN